MSGRLQYISERIAKGDPYSEIGKSLGLSRERIRQIARLHDLGGGHGEWARNKEEFVDMIRAGAPVHVAAEMCRVAPQAASRLAVANGRGKLAERHEWLAPFVERVRNGESIWSASGRDHALQNKIGRECNRLGVKSQAFSRWNPNPNPKPRRGKSGLSRSEAARVRWNSLSEEARTAHLAKMSKGRWTGGAPKGPFGEAKSRRSPHSPELRAKVKAFKGILSAAQIAQEFGLVSRNAVIGIWNRP